MANLSGPRSVVLALALAAAALGPGCEEDAAPDGDHDHDHDHDHAHDSQTAPGAVTEAPSASARRDAAVGADDAGVSEAFEWKLPVGFPLPVVPGDNPMSAAKVELGRHIFYDKRLSDNQTYSCANCHRQELAFTDARATGLGSTGQLHTRGAMSLANVAYASTLTWSNPLMVDLERQTVVPIFGDDPIELGMMSVSQVEDRLRAVPRYQDLFAAAFPDDAEPITMPNVQRALASFERTILSGDSPYDRYSNGDERALSESAKRGMIFVTTSEDPRFECNHCHGGFALTDHVIWDGLSTADAPPPYHQTGLYDVDGKGGYPPPNTGVYAVTLDPRDMGMFKAPTLRNIALTAPYMHDGSVATLEDVLDHYQKGGRARHVGRTDPLLGAFKISAQERADIIAFLQSLTDETLRTDPALSDPWPADGRGAAGGD